MPCASDSLPFVFSSFTITGTITNSFDDVAAGENCADWIRAGWSSPQRASAPGRGPYLPEAVTLRLRAAAAAPVIEAREPAFKSSPVASFANSRSPVLLVHGDDDRNVPFQQTTDLVAKLRVQNVAFKAIGPLSAQRANFALGTRHPRASLRDTSRNL